MQDKLLPTCTPEEVGVRSEDIAALIDRLSERQLHMHSIIGIRHGKIFFEGYYNPMTAERKHRMYSVSKTFVSAAIGLLCDEGKITLDDKVADYFPDKLPKNPSPYVLEMTVRDLLTMSTCYINSTYNLGTPDWTASFFNTPANHPSGTLFNYDTSATYTLNVLVERITGKPFLEYLKDKMLREAGFSEDAWCVKAPEGNQWGGSGVMCTSRDLAKFALIFMNGGKIGDHQVLSKEYVDMATSKQIDNNRSGYINDCTTGYGYGFFIWRTWRNSYSFLGMGDQNAICIPDKDMLFITTADNQGATGSTTTIFSSIWETVVDNAKDEAIAPDPDANSALAEKLASLSLPTLPGEASSEWADRVNGVTYTLKPNAMGITKLRLELDGDEGKFCFTNARGDKEIAFSIGKYKCCFFPETHYFGEVMLTPANRPYACAATGIWSSANMFTLRCDVIDDFFGNLTVTLGFRDNKVGVYMIKNAEWFLDDYCGIADGSCE